jgi:hypothetical protein
MTEGVDALGATPCRMVSANRIADTRPKKA